MWEQASPGLLGTWPLKQRYGGGDLNFMTIFAGKYLKLMVIIIQMLLIVLMLMFLVHYYY